MTHGKTLFEKIWEEHVVDRRDDGNVVLYVDRILLHEINSPQAFDALRRNGERLNRPETMLAVADHDVPTLHRAAGIADERVRHQVETLARNAAEFGVRYFAPDDPRHGITHVIGPEQGMILPGMVAVASDSHASTYGGLGAIGFGIGASEVESVFRSNTLVQRPAPTMRVRVDGRLPGHGVSAKDLILAIIGRIGADGAAGCNLEFTGAAVRALPMEARLTLANMTIEAGARAGLVAPDETTLRYLEGRPLAPTGTAWQEAVESWQTLVSDPDSTFDRDVSFDADGLAPHVTWGTSPEDVLPITACVPDPEAEADPERRSAIARAIDYMGLAPGMLLRDIRVDRVFIGSCTNGRIDDLVAAAEVATGRRVAPGVQAMIVPGSGLVKRQAEDLGLDRVFRDAGFEWRDAGCSLCNALNGDMLRRFERCASTSNRNFEHRQGRDGRTHLVSPAMAAAAAVTGRLADVRELLQESR